MIVVNTSSVCFFLIHLFVFYLLEVNCDLTKIAFFLDKLFRAFNYYIVDN